MRLGRNDLAKAFWLKKEKSRFFYVYVYIILRTPMGVYKEYFVIIIKTLLQIKNYIYDISHKVFKYEVVNVFYT